MFNELSGSTSGRQTQELEEDQPVLEVSDLQARIDWLNAHKPFIDQPEVTPMRPRVRVDTPPIDYEV
jgi:hypothetical protein